MEPTIEQPGSVPESTAVVDTPADDPDQDLIEAIDEGDALSKPAGEEDEIEDDWDGVKVKGKKAEVERIKSERLMQADYTRKTQELAQQRQQVQQAVQFQREFLNEATAVGALNMRLAEFDKVDWPALIQADEKQAAILKHQQGELAKQRDNLIQSLNARQAHTLQQQQAGLAQLKEQAAAYLSREVPGWTAERDAEVAQYVRKAGVPAEAIPNVIAHMPQWGVIAHKAYLYDSLVAKAAKKQPAAEQPAPVTRIAATRATANKDPSRMSDAEFAQWRKRQISQRN